VPFAKSEILNHMSELIRKSKLDEEAFQYLMDTLFAEIQMVEPDIIEPYREKAIEIMKSIDVLAMHLNCPIWSNDKHLKQQNHIKVYSTGEIMEQIQVIK
jgi:predicted nucleic acid-binding protein